MIISAAWMAALTPLMTWTLDNMRTVGFSVRILSTGLKASMLLMPLTMGSILRRNRFLLLVMPLSVPISISQVLQGAVSILVLGFARENTYGLKSDAHGVITSAWK